MTRQHAPWRLAVAVLALTPLLVVPAPLDAGSPTALSPGGGQAGPGATPTHTPTGPAVWPAPMGSPARGAGHTLDVEKSGEDSSPPSLGRGEGAKLSQGSTQPSPQPPTRLDPTPDGQVQRQVAVELHQQGRRDEWPCIFQLYRAESGWNPTAYGDAHLGGSYGLPQRHAPVWGEPEQWPWPIPDQVAWTVEYADDRYGDLCQAWDAWQDRADDNNVGGWW